MTRINPEDPKWTAYVLGELDETDRAAVERELAASEDARILVEELRLAADLTKAELREQVSVVPLTLQQREAIRASANAEVPRRWFGARPMVWAAGLAAASIALVVALTPHSVNPGGESLPLANPPAANFAQQSADVVQPEKSEPTRQAKDQPSNPSSVSAVYDRASSVEAPAAPAAPVVAEPPVIAQTSNSPANGQLSGTVKDASTALIPGVTVTATNARTGAVAKTQTDQKGTYVLDGLAPGDYQVRAELPGFQTNTSTGVQVGPGAVTQRDVMMQVGQVAQAVEVTVAAGNKLRPSASVPRGFAAGALPSEAPPAARAEKTTVPAPSIPPLIRAAEEGQIDNVRSLLKNGADLSVRDKIGRTALHAAAAAQQEATFVALVDSLTGPIRELVPEITKDSQIAVGEAVLAIDRRNTILNALDENGSTALMLAARNGWRDVCVTLVEHGANSTIRDKDGRSAADYAEAAGHADLAKYLRAHP